MNGPRVVAAGGEAAVAWYTEAGGPRVLVKRGAAKPVVISETALGRVDLVAKGDDLHVSWLEANGEIRVQRLGGRAVTVAKVPPKRSSGMPRMALCDEGILIAWTDPEANRVRTAIVR